MTQGIELKRDLGDDPWDAYVLRHEKSTFFHRAGWKRVMANAFGHRPHFLTSLRDHKTVGVLPLVQVRSLLFGHSLISNAFCVGGGILSSDEAARIALVDEAQKLGRQLGADYVEMRDQALADEGWQMRAGIYAGFERAIAANEDECLKQIPRKQRAVVRKTLESNLSFTVDRDVETFFGLYARTVRNHGTPVFPKRYFAELLSVFGQDCNILTVRSGGLPVSSVLSFYFRDRVLPYYTGSQGDARAAGSNDFMYWQLMRHAVARGCTTFDFGRSKLGTGPFAFKKNWGFEPRPITHSYYLLRAKALPNVSPTNPKYGPLIKAWRQMPLPLATFLSGFISRDLA